MAGDELTNPDSDPFKPPAIPTEVHCLHCGEEYESYLIEWRVSHDHKGRARGFWCCPVEGCGGAGFGFDMFPTDPEYVGEDGEPMWCFDDEEDEPWETEIEDDADGPLGPPPDFEAGDAADPDDDDDDIPW